MRHSSTNYLEVLTAQQSLLNVQQTLSQEKFDEIQSIICLYHALGFENKCIKDGVAFNFIYIFNAILTA